MSDIQALARRIDDLVEAAARYYESRSNFVLALDSLKKDDPDFLKKKKELLRDKTIIQWLDFYDNSILEKLNEIKSANDFLASAIKESKHGSAIASTPIKVGESFSQQARNLDGFIGLDKKTKAGYLKEFNIDKSYLKTLKPSEAAGKKLILEDFTIYKSTPVANLSNHFFEKLSRRLSKEYPQMVGALAHNLRVGDVKVLSRTYISMMFFFSSLILPVSFLVFFFLLSGKFLPVRIVLSLFISVMSALGSILFFYVYPSIIASSRKKKMKDELPFVTLHMAAVAGSGAHPISMFNLVLGTGEYKALEGEIKKVVNYTNLFGYSLTTALRLVSVNTPSEDFKDLLNGLVTTIEGGGDLKSFLNSKSDEVMTNYKLERKKYVETLATYSDIYTSILIAAPLLFFMTLAIIRMFGTEFMGVSISTIASVGTYGLIPLLNIVFVMFLSMTKPST